MIAMLTLTYPGHIIKQVTQAFMSPEMPKRPESMKVLSSISSYDDGGYHSVLMFDVPDAQVAEFIIVQSKRSTFFATRAPGCSGCLQWGTTVEDGIKNLMPLMA